METRTTTTELPTLRRLPTLVPGLDTILGGGVFVGDAYLINGEPGTGKTTLGNQMAYAHAAHGGTVLFVTLLTESHDRMLAHLGGLTFVDHSLIGERIQYISLLSTLEDQDLDGMQRTLVEMMRRMDVTLLIVDGTGVAQTFADSDFSFAHFLHSLQARTAVLGCTTVLLASPGETGPIATHVDGVVHLTNTPRGSTDSRSLRVQKLRGSRFLSGYHAFAISANGITVFPRLEATLSGLEPHGLGADERVSFGVSGLDDMTDGGVPSRSSTLLLGTPGAGKTMLGLQFLAAGARQGERGLIAGFQETTLNIVSTARRAGFDLQPYLDTGTVRVMWRHPLEFEPDEWAWNLLAEVDTHRPRRLVIDAFSDLVRLFALPERQTPFARALMSALQHRGVTTLVLMEIDVLAGQALTIPIPNMSATMDVGVLLRSVEVGSTLRRMLSIFKLRETGFDPTIREFTIGEQGITIGSAFNAEGLLTGTATRLDSSG